MKARIALSFSLLVAGIACQSRERDVAAQKCSRGVAEACLTAGSFETDPKEADRFYRRACTSGAVEGCLKAIGDDPAVTCRGEGAVLCNTLIGAYTREKKTDRVLDLLGRLCDGGDPAACVRRRGMELSRCRAGEWPACQALKAECRQGQIESCRLLHQHYRLRCVVDEPTTCSEARDVARIACAAGDDPSCQSLASQLQAECGRGMADACAAHRTLTVEACGRGLSWACDTLEDADLRGCRALDPEACTRLDSACRMGASAHCAYLDDILWDACQGTPAVCAILVRRCQASGAKNLCSAALSGYDMHCRAGKGKREACDALADLCHKGDEDACKVAKLTHVPSFAP